MSLIIFDELEQGSTEWLDLRKSKVTATDASIIMGASKWKSKEQLFKEKMSPEHKTFKNAAMQRGIDLEPFARSLFEVETGIATIPLIGVNDWAMASLDGFSEIEKCVLEIKCPGDRDHSIALSGEIPDHYYPQVQFQMYVFGVEMGYYYSFDGFQGAIVKVPRNDEYINVMVVETHKFWLSLEQVRPYVNT